MNTARKKNLILINCKSLIGSSRALLHDKAAKGLDHRAGRVWALVEHTTEGGLYRSDDVGDTWEILFDELAPVPPRFLGRLRELRSRVVLGSDFPNIPYPYAHQLEALERLDLGSAWLRAVCWDNGVRLLGSP